MKQTKRLSNIELVRILAILFVLIFHSNFHTLGIPDANSVLSRPLCTFSSFCIQGITAICVDVFVLISGWFGIRPNLKSACKLIYIVFFFMFGSYLYALSIGIDSFSMKYIAHCLLLDDYAWFVKSYLCLYIISPILNSYCVDANRKAYRNLLIAFYLFQTLYGWITNAASFFHYGSSVVSFIGLYLLAQYARRFSPSWTTYSKYYYIACYLFLTFAASTFLLLIASVKVLSPVYQSIVGHMYAYSSPLVIVESLCFILFFIKIPFQSRMINFIAASSFSALFVHGNPYIITYQEQVISFYNMHSYPVALLYVLLWSLFAFIIAIILDQLRKSSWQLLIKYW